MLQGFSEVQKHFRKEQVNRIILLSDGLANAGISEPSQIASEASKIREHRISVSTMGVGLDYNENLMTNIADASGGNYYYISPETSMAEIFRKEWNLMQNMVATNARATFELGTGVKVADVAGFKWDQAGNKLTIQVPDIYSGETRRILVQLQVPTGAEQTIAVGKGTFICTDISSKTPRQFAASFNPEVRVIKDQTIVMKNLDEEVNKRAASVVASKEMQQAYALYEEGKNDEAFGRAQQVVDKLRALGYVEGDQINRYEQNVLRMDPTKAAPPASAVGKDFLKKQKEEERKVQQNDQQ
jgi:Ca-activated chloride channel family protein